MAAASVDIKRPHALVVPGSGQGHVNACMLLATSLAALGFKVSFVYFSSEYAKLTAKKTHVAVPTSNSSSCDSYCNKAKGTLHIHVVEDAFAPGDVDKPFFVTPSMKENLFKLILQLRLQGTPPTCLVSDSFISWTLHVAQRADIPRINYWPSNAMSCLLLTNLLPLFSQGTFPEKGAHNSLLLSNFDPFTQGCLTQWKMETPIMLDHIQGLSPFSSELYPWELRFVDSSHSLVQFFKDISSSVKFGERTLIHTMSELEPDAFHAFQIAGTSAYAIGPLLHFIEEHKDKEESALVDAQEKLNFILCGVDKQEDCMSWLDLQAELSVIYVAFGSFASLCDEETREIAMGLEASGNPFLWVIREGSQGGAEMQQVLPEGFLDRTRGKGMIIKWAPQMEVLAHKAVGGFLSHCGWNSIVESLWEGVPMLCCPRFGEQRLNSHYMCNVWGTGLELERTYMGGLERGFVELGVKALMKGEPGLKARSKSQEVMHISRKTCQQRGKSFANLQKFYDDMELLCS